MHYWKDSCDICLAVPHTGCLCVFLGETPLIVPLHLHCCFSAQDNRSCISSHPSWKLKSKLDYSTVFEQLSDHRGQILALVFV